MSDMAKRTYDDSRSMRIATVIALLYVPASLVLVRKTLIMMVARKKNTYDRAVAEMVTES